MQDMPNMRRAPKMIRIGLLFLCLAYAHTAVAAVAHQRHSSPSKKTTILLDQFGKRHSKWVRLHHGRPHDPF
jgi:hypothetical protein